MECLSIEFLMDVGRLLGFNRQPNSDSFHHAGKSYLMTLAMTAMHQDSQGTDQQDGGGSPGSDDDNDDEEEVDAAPTEPVVGNTLTGALIRSCVLCVWFQHTVQSKEPWTERLAHGE